MRLVTIAQAARILESSESVVRTYMRNWSIERISGGTGKKDPIMLNLADVERVRRERATDLRTWRSRLVIIIDHPGLPTDELKRSGLSLRTATSVMDAISQVPIGDTPIIVLHADEYRIHEALISTFEQEGAKFIPVDEDDSLMTTMDIIRSCWQLVGDRSQGLI